MQAFLLSDLLILFNLKGVIDVDNGFKLQSEVFRQLAVDGVIDEQYAKKCIEVYNFLAQCDSEMFAIMLNSGSFNSLLKKIGVDISEVDFETM